MSFYTPITQVSEQPTVQARLRITVAVLEHSLTHKKNGMIKRLQSAGTSMMAFNQKDRQVVLAPSKNRPGTSARTTNASITTT